VVLLVKRARRSAAKASRSGYFECSTTLRGLNLCHIYDEVSHIVGHRRIGRHLCAQSCGCSLLYPCGSILGLSSNNHLFFGSGVSSSSLVERITIVFGHAHLASFVAFDMLSARVGALLCCCSVGLGDVCIGFCPIFL
jgi:hypothetical protein